MLMTSSAMLYIKEIIVSKSEFPSQLENGGEAMNERLTSSMIQYTEENLMSDPEFLQLEKENGGEEATNKEDFLKIDNEKILEIDNRDILNIDNKLEKMHETEEQFLKAKLLSETQSPN
ncbi:unnamed protein product [Lasius platythorax]